MLTLAATRCCRRRSAKKTATSCESPSRGAFADAGVSASIARRHGCIPTGERERSLTRSWPPAATRAVAKVK